MNAQRWLVKGLFVLLVAATAPANAVVVTFDAVETRASTNDLKFYDLSFNVVNDDLAEGVFGLRFQFDPLNYFVYINERTHGLAWNSELVDRGDYQAGIGPQLDLYVEGPLESIVLGDTRQSLVTMEVLCILGCGFSDGIDFVAFSRGSGVRSFSGLATNVAEPPLISLFLLGLSGLVAQRRGPWLKG